MKLFSIRVSDEVEGYLDTKEHIVDNVSFSKGLLWSVYTVDALSEEQAIKLLEEEGYLKDPKHVIEIYEIN